VVRLSTGASSPVVGTRMVTYDPALRKRDAMPNEDHQVTARLAKASKAPRYARITIALLLVGGLVTAAFMVIKDGGSAKASKNEVRDPTPASRSHTPKSINEQGQLIARLKEILATREQAYRRGTLRR
jgi:hypothetical protein